MISFTHKVHARSRSLKLKIEKDGQVVVVTPPRISAAQVTAFITSHLSWIEQTRAQLLQRQVFSQTSDSVSLFGQAYPRKVSFEPTEASGVKLQNGELVIALIPDLKHPQGSPTVIQTQIDRFVQRTAEKYIIPRTHQLAKVMNIEFKNITLRHQKSRWGSCSSQGNLNFNWRLVHYPTEVIDYVIIHELAHRRQMNHSAAFWNIVKQYDPAFSQHRGWLKRHGSSLD